MISCTSVSLYVAMLFSGIANWGSVLICFGFPIKERHSSFFLKSSSTSAVSRPLYSSAGACSSLPGEGFARVAEVKVGGGVASR